MEKEELMEEKKQLIKNKERCKVAIVASIILLVCDIISLVFSILTKENNIIESKEIGYIIVSGVCVLIIVVLIPVLIKVKKDLNKVKSQIGE